MNVINVFGSAIAQALKELIKGKLSGEEIKMSRLIVADIFRLASCNYHFSVSTFSM